MTKPALAVALAIGLTCCGGSRDEVAPDAPTPDGRVEGDGDAHTYVVDSVTIPLNASEAEDLGFDLDGDTTIDNQLGNIYSALISSGLGELDLQGWVDDAVNAGRILLLANLRATSLTTAANVGFSLYQGANPSPTPCTDPLIPQTCRRHLAGTGSFDIRPDSPTDGVVIGNVVAGRFEGGNGTLQLQLAFGDRPISVTLLEAQARLIGISEARIVELHVGGVVAESEVQAELIPGLHVAVADQIGEDCAGTSPPECGCTADSPGLTWLGIFDRPMSAGCPDCVVDCSVTLEEVQQNAVIVTLLRPDVDTSGDGEPDALSMGVGATAVAGTYTAPPI